MEDLRRTAATDGRSGQWLDLGDTGDASLAGEPGCSGWGTIEEAISTN